MKISISADKSAEMTAKAAKSALQKEYMAYFQNHMEEADIGSPAELDEEEAKDFFNRVARGWRNGVGEK